jgi:hypothetical protein
MELYLKRTIKLPERTIGEFTVNNKLVYTIEDTDRGLDSSMDLAFIKRTKIKAKTAIPIGRYQIKSTYSPRFSRNTLQLIRVPGFDGIRVHSGNTELHTEGCLIIGFGTDKKTKVTESVNAVKYVEKYLFEVLSKENVYITITN